MYRMIKCAATWDSDAGWVIMNGDKEFYVSKSKSYGGYSPTFTGVRYNNYYRTKVFNSEEEAQAFINENKKQLFRYTKGLKVISLQEAREMKGDTAAAKKQYKQELADNAKERRKRDREASKEEDAAKAKKQREYNPGTYQVTFNYANFPFDGRTFKVEADSINDAFAKAKEAALRYDPYCGSSGYSDRLKFNKNKITKIG